MKNETDKKIDEKESNYYKEDKDEKELHHERVLENKKSLKECNLDKLSRIMYDICEFSNDRSNGINNGELSKYKSGFKILRGKAILDHIKNIFLNTNLTEIFCDIIEKINYGNDSHSLINDFKNNTYFFYTHEYKNGSYDSLHIQHNYESFIQKCFSEYYD